MSKLKLEKFKNQEGRIKAALKHQAMIEKKRELNPDMVDEEIEEEVTETNPGTKSFSRKKFSPPDPRVKIIDEETAAKIDYGKIVVIGASTGGPGAVVEVLNGLPHVFPPVIVVQHMPRDFVPTFVERLQRLSRLNVKLAEDGDRIRKNTVYVAQGGRHLELEAIGESIYKIKITDGPLVNFVKPAVDVTLFSVARIFGAKSISVILTGIGYDGREGSRTIKKLGGTVIAQNEESCVVYGMNKGVIESNIADTVADISIIAKILVKEVTK